MLDEINKYSEAVKKTWSNPETAAKHSEASKRSGQDPVANAARSVKSKSTKNLNRINKVLSAIGDRTGVIQLNGIINLLGVDKSTIFRWSKAGNFPEYVYETYFRLDEIRELMNRQLKELGDIK